MESLVRVGLVFNYDLGYSRGVLRGVKQFAQCKPRWALTLLNTEALDAAALRALRPVGLIANVFSEALAAALGALRVPLVNTVAIVPGLTFPHVGVDNVRVGELAAAHLVERGFRHFGFVGHPRHFYAQQRGEGFRRALAGREHSPACHHEHPGRSYRNRGRLLAPNERLQRWVAGLPKPAGVFACHDVWGLQVVEAAQFAGLRVPEDVAVVGVDNDDLLCELARPSLSSVVVPAERIGYEAAALLDRLMAGGKPPRTPVLIPPPCVATRRSSDVLGIDDPDVTAALRFLREHAHAPMRVRDLLEAVPVSRRALERRFRELLGRGIAEEIRRAHVERAKHLLTTTELTMAEVTERSGFASQPQLSRVFREETGLTPTAFRRQARVPSGRAG